MIGLGIGTETRCGALYALVTSAAGDLAFGGNDGLWCCRISSIFSSRVVSAVKGIFVYTSSKLSSSSSICSNSSIVKSKFRNGLCGDRARSRSPDPVGTDRRSPDPVGTGGSDPTAN